MKKKFLIILALFLVAPPSYAMDPSKPLMGYSSEEEAVLVEEELPGISSARQEINLALSALQMLEKSRQKDIADAQLTTYKEQLDELASLAKKPDLDHSDRQIIEKQAKLIGARAQAVKMWAEQMQGKAPMAPPYKCDGESATNLGVALSADDETFTATKKDLLFPQRISPKILTKAKLTCINRRKSMMSASAGEELVPAPPIAAPSIPMVVPEERRIALIVVHEGMDLDLAQTELAKFAVDRMNYHSSDETPINHAEIIDIKWRAKKCEGCRALAGEELGRCIATWFSNRNLYSHLYLVSFKNSGNVALHAANYLKHNPVRYDPVRPLINGLINILTPNIAPLAKPSADIVGTFLNFYTTETIPLPKEGEITRADVGVGAAGAAAGAMAGMPTGPVGMATGAGLGSVSALQFKWLGDKTMATLMSAAKTAKNLGKIGLKAVKEVTGSEGCAACGKPKGWMQRVTTVTEKVLAPGDWVWNWEQHKATEGPAWERGTQDYAKHAININVHKLKNVRTETTAMETEEIAPHDAASLISILPVIWEPIFKAKWENLLTLTHLQRPEANPLSTEQLEVAEIPLFLDLVLDGTTADLLYLRSGPDQQPFPEIQDTTAPGVKKPAISVAPRILVDAEVDVQAAEYYAAYDEALMLAGETRDQEIVAKLRRIHEQDRTLLIASLAQKRGGIDITALDQAKKSRATMLMRLTPVRTTLLDLALTNASIPVAKRNATAAFQELTISMAIERLQIQQAAQTLNSDQTNALSQLIQQLQIIRQEESRSHEEAFSSVEREASEIRHEREETLQRGWLQGLKVRLESLIIQLPSVLLSFDDPRVLESKYHLGAESREKINALEEGMRIINDPQHGIANILQDILPPCMLSPTQKEAERSAQASIPPTSSWLSWSLFQKSAPSETSPVIMAQPKSQQVIRFEEVSPNLDCFNQILNIESNYMDSFLTKIQRLLVRTDARTTTREIFEPITMLSKRVTQDLPQIVLMAEARYIARKMARTADASGDPGGLITNRKNPRKEVAALIRGNIMKQLSGAPENTLVALRSKLEEAADQGDGSNEAEDTSAAHKERTEFIAEGLKEVMPYRESEQLRSQMLEKLTTELEKTVPQEIEILQDENRESAMQRATQRRQEAQRDKSELEQTISPRVEEVSEEREEGEPSESEESESEGAEG